MIIRIIIELIVKLMSGDWLPRFTSTRSFTMSSLVLAFMLLPSLLWAGAMQIEAEKMIFYHKQNRVEFTRNVQVKRDDFIISCDRLVVNYSKGENTQLEFVDAFGHVTMTQGARQGKADTARLDQKKNILTLIGNAVLEQPGGRIEGETIIHHMSSEKTEVYPVKGGRTHMTIETSDKGNDPLPGAGK
jgi:lipopolysaccharide export system protein LptA